MRKKKKKKETTLKSGKNTCSVKHTNIDFKNNNNKALYTMRSLNESII